MADFLANNARNEEVATLELLTFDQPLSVIRNLLYHDLLNIHESRIINPMILC